MTKKSNQKIRNLQETLNYLGLNTPLEIDEDFVSINLRNLITSLPYKSPPFRTNLYSVTLVVDAYGHFTTDKTSFKIEPNLLFFNNPGSLRQIEWNNISKIHHYTFNEHFLLKYAGIHIYEMFPFLLMEFTTPNNTEKNIYQELQKICQKIDFEYESNCHHKKYILANLLTRLLLKIKESFWTDINSKNNNTDKKNETDVLKNFIDNIEHHFEKLLTGRTNVQLRVKDYAKKQNLHENYFSQIIKEKSGKTTNQWINEKNYFVAIRLIEDSSLSIKEISYNLGYQHPSHFSSFFKKNTGFSPVDYRKMINNTTL